MSSVCNSRRSASRTNAPLPTALHNHLREHCGAGVLRMLGFLDRITDLGVVRTSREV